MITPPGHYKPVGDPTRWGAQIVQLIPAPATDAQAIYQSEQFISAHTNDPYPRPWSLIGTLSAPNFMYSLPDPAVGVAPQIDEWSATLSLTLGTGQAQIVHNLNLRAIIDADSPFYRNSNAAEEMFATLGFRVAPFIVPGAIVANAISIRVIHTISFSAPATAFPLTTTVLLTPLAAGEGL